MFPRFTHAVLVVLVLLLVPVSVTSQEFHPDTVRAKLIMLDSLEKGAHARIALTVENLQVLDSLMVEVKSHRNNVPKEMQFHLDSMIVELSTKKEQGEHLLAQEEAMLEEITRLRTILMMLLNPGPNRG